MNSRYHKPLNTKHTPHSRFAEPVRLPKAWITPLTGMVLTLLSSSGFAQDLRPASDVEYQIQSLRAKGDVLGARVHPDMPTLSLAHHWQGFARHPDPNLPYFYASASYPTNSGGGVLAIMKIDSPAPVDNRIRSNRHGPLNVGITNPPVGDRMVKLIRFPNHYHPGSISTAGKYMVLSLHTDITNDPNVHDETHIYDISDPLNPVSVFEAEYSDPDSGIVQLSDGRWLLAHSRGSVHFWYSSTAGDITQSTFFNINIWQPDNSFYDCGNSIFNGCPPQSINLVLQGDDPTTPNINEETVYMIVLKNTEDFGNGSDLVGVYELEIGPVVGGTFSLNVTHRFDVQFPNDSSGNFRAGSSVWVAPNGELIIYKCPHYNNGGPPRVLPFIEHSSYRGSWNGAWSFPCMGHVQLYTDKDLNDAAITKYSAGVDVADYLYEDYSRLDNIDPITTMGDAVSSVAWTLPIGCTARLWQNANFGGHYIDLPGTNSPQWISDLSTVNWTDTATGNPNNKVSSLEFIGGSPEFHYHADPGSTVNIATSLQLLWPGGPCSVLNLRAGSYPGQITIDQPVTLRPTGGIAVIAGP